MNPKDMLIVELKKKVAELEAELQIVGGERDIGFQERRNALDKLDKAEAARDALERCLQIWASSLWPMADPKQNERRIAAVKQSERRQRQPR